jgi:hypothetical protein
MNSVRTAKKTTHFTVTKINWLTLFKEIIAVYSENYLQHISTLCGQNTELLHVKQVVYKVTTWLNGLVKLHSFAVLSRGRRKSSQDVSSSCTVTCFGSDVRITRGQQLTSSGYVTGVEV